MLVVATLTTAKIEVDDGTRVAVQSHGVATDQQVLMKPMHRPVVARVRRAPHRVAYSRRRPIPAILPSGASVNVQRTPIVSKPAR